LRAHVQVNLTCRLQGATLSALNIDAAHMFVSHIGLFGILHEKLLVKKLHVLTVCARAVERAADGILPLPL
jgi:hypothetical protein